MSSVDPERVYLLPFLIKLGLMKNFVKTMDAQEVDFNIFKTQLAPKKKQYKSTGIYFYRTKISPLN